MTLVFAKARRPKGTKVGREIDPTERARGARPTPNEAAVQDCYRAAVGTLRDAATGVRVKDALRAGDATRALNALPWEKFVGELTAMRDAIKAEVVESARDNAEHLYGQRALAKSRAGKGPEVPKGEKVALPPHSIPLDFTRLDDRAIAWAERHVGSLIQGLQVDDRASVREIIANALRGNATVDQAATLLSRTIGLSSRSAQAVSNQWDRLVEQAVRNGATTSDAMSRADDMTNDYADRLLDSRAMTISRTEIVTASNEGRAESWQAGVDAGYIGDDSTKEWVALDGCPECDALDGEEVPYTDNFSSGDDMPPAHPNCRCTAVLHYTAGPGPDEAASGEASAPEIDTAE